VRVDTRGSGTGRGLSQKVFDKTLALIPEGERPLCVLEVGAADGRGTTMSLVRVSGGGGGGLKRGAQGSSRREA
jgi:hypothetical protein